MGGISVFAYVIEQALNHAEDSDLGIGRQALLLAGDDEVTSQLAFGFKVLHVSLEGRVEAEVVQHHRSQVEDKLSHFLKGTGYRAFQVTQFGASSQRVGVEQSLADLGLQDEVRKRLGWAVMHLTSQPLTLILLGTDNAYDRAAFGL